MLAVQSCLTGTWLTHVNDNSTKGTFKLNLAHWQCMVKKNISQLKIRQVYMASTTSTSFSWNTTNQWTKCWSIFNHVNNQLSIDCLRAVTKVWAEAAERSEITARRETTVSAQAAAPPQAVQWTLKCALYFTQITVHCTLYREGPAIGQNYRYPGSVLPQTERVAVRGAFWTRKKMQQMKGDDSCEVTFTRWTWRHRGMGGGR